MWERVYGGGGFRTGRGGPPLGEWREGGRESLTVKPHNTGGGALWADPKAPMRKQSLRKPYG